MAGNDRKKGLDREGWDKVRAAYFRGPLAGNVMALAREYGISRNAIKRHIESEGWILSPEIAEDVEREALEVVNRKKINEETKSKVVQMASYRAVESMEKSGVLDSISSNIAEAERARASALYKANRATELAADFVVDFLENAKSISPAMGPGEQTRADVAKSVLSVYRSFITTFRDDIGVIKGVPTVPKEGTGDGKPTEIEFVIVDAPKAAEA